MSVSQGYRHRPRVVHICPTDRCNLECIHCDIWKTKIERELATDEWKAILLKLGNWLGPVTLKFAGGEPLMRKDIAELAKFCAGLGMEIGINTNGVILRENLVTELVDAGLAELNISLDSIEAATHDRIRGRRGVYDEVMEALDRLLAGGHKMKINVAFTVMEPNLEHIPRMMQWALDRKVNVLTFQALYQNFGAPYDPLWHGKSGIFPRDAEKINAAFEKIFEFKMRNGVVSNSLVQLSMMRAYFLNPAMHTWMECQAGYNDVAVDSLGMMRLCFNLDPVGDLTTGDPEEIYNGPLSWERRKQVAACKRNCSLLNCNFSW